MNSENFHEYLKNPSMLHQVSYQELKSLVLQYPYSPNLRYLLLIKSMFEQNSDYDRNLVMASMSSIDRQKLRKLVDRHTVVQSIQETFALDEEFLELKDLSTLEDIPATTPEPPPVELAAERPASLENMPSEEENLDDVESERIEPSAEPFEEIGFFDEILEDLENDEETSVGESASKEPTAPDESEAPSIEDILMDMSGEPVSDAVESVLEEEVGEIEEEVKDEIIEEEFSLEEILGQNESEEEVKDDEAEIPTESSSAAVRSAALAPKEVGDVPMEITNDVFKEEDVPEAVAEEPVGEPAPVPDLDSWLNRLEPAKNTFLADEESKELVVDLEESPEPEEQPLGSEPEDNAKEVAAKSILEDADIATETLAGIFERQGHYDKAIAMYERLSLKFPEKSSFFAAKIKELKNIK